MVSTEHITKIPKGQTAQSLPVGLKFVLRFIFKAAKDYPDECEATRKDIDRRLSAALKEWREESAIRDSRPFDRMVYHNSHFFMLFLEKSALPLFTYAQMYNILKSISA